MSRSPRNTQDDLTAVGIALGHKHADLNARLAAELARGDTAAARNTTRRLDQVDSAISEFITTLSDPSQHRQG